MGKDLPSSGLGYFRGRKRMAARRYPAVLGLGRRCRAASLGLLLASVSSALSLVGAFVSSPARGVASVRRQPPPAVSIRREIRGGSLLLRRSEMKSGRVARLDCQAGEDLTMPTGKIMPIVPSEAGYLPEFDVGPSSVPSGLRLAGAFQNVSRHFQEIPSVLALRTTCTHPRLRSRCHARHKSKTRACISWACARSMTVASMRDPQYTQSAVLLPDWYTAADAVSFIRDHSSLGSFNPQDGQEEEEVVPIEILYVKHKNGTLVSR